MPLISRLDGDDSPSIADANGIEAEKLCREKSSCKHEWVVFSTALQERWLMLQCVECGLHGTVEEPTAEEWSQAFHAPSRPYRYEDETRVTPKMNGTPCVRRLDQNKLCNCVCECCRGELRYERLWFSQLKPNTSPTAEEASEILELAGFVESQSQMCSHWLPFFIVNLERDMGVRHASIVQEIISRIKALDDAGRHHSASAIARLLRLIAEDRTHG